MRLVIPVLCLLALGCASLPQARGPGVQSIDLVTTAWADLDADETSASKTWPGGAGIFQAAGSFTGSPSVTLEFSLGGGWATWDSASCTLTSSLAYCSISMGAADVRVVVTGGTGADIVTARLSRAHQAAAPSPQPDPFSAISIATGGTVLAPTLTWASGTTWPPGIYNPAGTDDLTITRAGFENATSGTFSGNVGLRGPINSWGLPRVATSATVPTLLPGNNDPNTGGGRNTSTGSFTLIDEGATVASAHTSGFTVADGLLFGLPCSSTPPAGGVKGDLWCDSDLTVPCYHNGTNWVQMDDFATVCT